MNFDREIGRLVTMRDGLQITLDQYDLGMRRVQDAIVQYLASLGDTVAVDPESGEVREIEQTMRRHLRTQPDNADNGTKYSWLIESNRTGEWCSRTYLNHATKREAERALNDWQVVEPQTQFRLRRTR
jgi:hypothetical protein